MSIAGEIGGLLGGMTGKIADPIFWFYAPVVSVLIWRKLSPWVIPMTLAAWALNAMAICSRIDPDLGVYAYLMLIWTFWALVIFCVCYALRRVSAAS